jgi:HNH endonuclease
MSGRGTISDTTTLRLWAQAGGRCEYHGCNRYLLEDDLTTYTLNLAERAHIVGATDAPRSPRGDDPLSLADRNQADNLMLLCRDHHRVIDRLLREHGVDGLRRMKRGHEDRIRLLTGLHENGATVVVRAIGGIRDAPVDIPRQAVLAAVVADGRFPRFPLAMAGEDLEVDLRVLRPRATLATGRPASASSRPRPPASATPSSRSIISRYSRSPASRCSSPWVSISTTRSRPRSTAGVAMAPGTAAGASTPTRSPWSLACATSLA